MDLLLVHNDVFFLANKEQNFWPREEVDAALHRASMIKFNDALRRYAVDQEAQDDLAPFKRKLTIDDVNSIDGEVDLNADGNYARFIAAYKQYTDSDSRTRQVPIEILNETQLAQRLDSQLEEVSSTAPVAIISEYGKLQVYPEESFAGYAFYFKKPDAPAMSYTIADDRTFTYDSGGSTQLEWADTCIMQIVIKAVELLGVNIDSARLLQYTQYKDPQRP